MPRVSHHVEPSGPVAIARHYMRDLVYGANDGIITTFAVVAGVAGGGLSLRVVLIVGAANLFADGLSMAAGNYLSDVIPSGAYSLTFAYQRPLNYVCRLHPDATSEHGTLADAN